VNLVVGSGNVSRKSGNRIRTAPIRGVFWAFAAFVALGTLAAAASSPNELARIRTISYPVYFPYLVALDPDGRLYVASTTVDRYEERHESPVGAVQVYPAGTSSLPIRTTCGSPPALAILTDASKNLYVSNPNAFVDPPSIVEYAASGAVKRSITPPGLGATALALDVEGNLYAGTDDGVVAMYRPSATTAARTIDVARGRIAALATDERYLYVAASDGKKACICVYSLAGGRLVRTIADGIDQPTALAFDRSGALYVANRPGTVAVYVDGVRRRTIATEQSAVGLAMSPSGDLYVRTGAAIDVFPRAGTTRAFRIVVGGGVAGDMAMDRNGHLYVGDGHIVGEYTAPPNAASLAGSIAPAPFHAYTPASETKVVFSPNVSPSYVAFAGDGTPWIAGDHFVARVGPDGKLASYTLGAPNANDAGVVGIAIGPGDVVWLLTQARGPGQRDSIARVTPNGGVSTFPLNLGDGEEPIVSPRDIAMVPGSDAAMWFANPFSNTIVRIAPDGSVTTFRIPVSDTNPAKHLTPGADGALWFWDDGRIGRLTIGGVFTMFPPHVADTPFIAFPGGTVLFSKGLAIDTISTTGAISVVYKLPETCTVSFYDFLTVRDGAMWFLENGASIAELSQDGTLHEYPFANFAGSYDDGEPYFKRVSPDGSIWYQGGSDGTFTRATLPSP
jgi:sugar lactone lactonase YvrE